MQVLSKYYLYCVRYKRSRDDSAFTADMTWLYANASSFYKKFEHPYIAASKGVMQITEDICNNKGYFLIVLATLF